MRIGIFGFVCWQAN